MNLFLEQAAEEIDQAISDADQLQALVKATIQRFTNYLKRRQQEKMERRYHLNTTIDESNSMKFIDKSAQAQHKILEFFNKMHKDVDKTFRELKEMIPSNPQTYVIEDIKEQEPAIKQPEVKLPQKSVPPEAKYFSIFKQSQNGGQSRPNPNNFSLGSQLPTTYPQPQNQIPMQQNSLQPLNQLITQQNQLIVQQNQNIQQQKESTLQKLNQEQQTVTINYKPPQPEKEASFTYGRLQKFQYYRLKYPVKNEGTCIFCGLEAKEQNLGPLLLIPSSKSPNQKYQLHEMCALWSQNLVFSNGAGSYCEPTQIDDEVEKSKKNKCFLCSRTGATLCCAICPQAFHFNCLMKSSSTGKLVEEEFKFFCDKHKSKVGNDEKKKKKANIKLNQSKANIKTSPKRSPRKSPKRRKSPASQGYVARYLSTNDDSKPSETGISQQLASMLQQQPHEQVNNFQEQQQEYPQFNTSFDQQIMEQYVRQEHRHSECKLEQ